VEALMAVSTPLFPKFELIGTDIFIPTNPGGAVLPGDNLEVMVILLNDEDWGTATNISTVLSSESNQINITNHNMNFENAWPGMPVVNDGNPFLIELSSSIEPGEYEFTLNLTSNEDDYVQYQTEFNFTLLVEEGSQVMAGDVNMDSEVNILDVVITANAALGQIELTPEQFQAADVNGDDTINILDIVQIVNIILG
jgi:phage terminase Nu1 subunit (DNA packaging protein)